GATLMVTNGLILNGSAAVGNATNGSYGTIEFLGTQSLGGSGEVVFGNSGNNALFLSEDGMTLTIGAGLTIHGKNGMVGVYNTDPPPSGSLINHGTISADESGGTIIVNAQMNTATLGNIQSGNGIVELAYALTNNGQTILLSGPSNYFTLGHGTIIGGTIIATNGASFCVSGSGSLNGVTIYGMLDVGNTYSGANLTVTNGLALNGTLLLGNPTNSSFGGVGFLGSQTLAGNGVVTLGNDNYNLRGYAGRDAIWLGDGGTTLTIGPGITIQGQNGVIGAYTSFPWYG